MQTMEAFLKKSEVKKRVADWKKRLNALMDSLETWSDSIPKIQKQRGEIEVQEEIMKEHQLDPVKLPTFSLISGKRRLAFVPSTLWIVGAKGRVNVVGNSRVFTLLDRGGAPGTSQWVIAGRSLSEKDRPLTKTELKCLVASELMR